MSKLLEQEDSLIYPLFVMFTAPAVLALGKMAKRSTQGCSLSTTGVAACKFMINVCICISKQAMTPTACKLS